MHLSSFLHAMPNLLPLLCCCRYSLKQSGAAVSESESGEHSPHEVKGSSMDDPHQSEIPTL